MRWIKTVVLGTLLISLLNRSTPLPAAPVGIFDNAIDIGAPPRAGSTVVDGALYTLHGSGANIWDGGDQFHFAYKRVRGDFTATIHISSRSTTPAGSGTQGRHGLMARWGTGTSSKYSMVACVLPTADVPQAASPPFYQFRLNDGQNIGNRINYLASDDTFPTEGRMPSWMRLERRGATIHGYLSEDVDADGLPDRWCFIGSDTGIDRDELLVGVALHSQAGTNLGTITFDNVSIDRQPSPAPLECTQGDNFIQTDFAAGFGSLAESVSIGLPSPNRYTPRVRNGRLRLTEEGSLYAGTAVWYDVAGSEALAASGFEAEFDAYMTKSGLPGDVNPGDGMTFAVIQGGNEILGLSEDRTEPSIPRFTNSALVWTGTGCQPTAPSAFVRDLTPGAGVSFSTVVSNGDIWEGGDSFSYQYAPVTGDFDLSVHVVSYGHGTGIGDWGKYGLMARQTLAPTSRYTMAQAHGPSLSYPARQAGRQIHLEAGAPGYEVVFPGLGARPRFLRLTRRGNVIQGWASDDQGLQDGSLSRCNDSNWVAGSPDDWGGDAPETIFLGFANSNHNSSGCTAQSIFYQGLPACSATPVGRSDLVGALGGYLGYGGGTLLARAAGHPSFAVEMDNWVGGGEPGNDPPDAGAPAYDGKYHFGLDVNAEVTSIQNNVDFGVPTNTLPNIFDPTGVHVKVRYAPDGQVEVFARANTAPFNEYLVLSERIPPLSGTMLFGFTAGTGDATATHEVDNFSVTALTCSQQPPSSLAPRIIDLGNITGGGDGLRDTTAVHTGVDPRNGAFTSGYFEGRLNDSDGVFLAPGPSPYIDSVFYIEATLGPEGVLPASLTQSGVDYYFPSFDATGSGWNYILKDRNGGVSTPGITVGPFTGFTTAVGIHASTGITYNLDQLRAQHGASNVRCFSTLWGLDGCATGDVNLYAILSSDAGGILAERRFRATSRSFEVVRMPIPVSAQYLTLATGSNGLDNCDHGTFARAIITGAPCPSYSSLAWLWTVLPSLLSTAGGDLTFGGEFLDAENTLRVGGVDLTDLFFINAQIHSGRLPPLSPGFYDAEVVSSDGDVVIARLKNAVEVTPPVVIAAIEPRDVFRDGETQVTVRGEYFRPSTRIQIELIPGEDAFDLLDPIFVSETEITGRLPALPADQPSGFRKVIARDTRGEVELAPGVQYVDPSSVRLTAVDPPTVPTQGGTRVTFSGAGFIAGLMIPRIAGEPLLDVTFVSDAEIVGSTPLLPAGFQDADIQSSGGNVLVTLPDAVEVIPPESFAIRSVSPATIPAGQSSELAFEGEGFHPGLTPRLGGVPLVGVTFVDEGHLQGFAPDLALGFHDADLVNADGAAVAVLASAVEVVPAPPVDDLPAPAEIDGVFAEGQARFTWSNPLAYDRIVATEVFAGGGIGRIFELAGNKTNLLVPASRDGIALKFKGFLRERISADSLSYAYPAECGQPTPLGGYGVVGKLDFPLFGGNLPKLPARCASAPATPAAGFGDDGLGGGGAAFDLATEWASINGFEEVGAGYSVTARNRSNLAALIAAFGPHRYSNRLVTGFTLDQDADRLQIEGFYQKTGEAPGLALMGRLVHVFPQDGFEDEFTLPDAAPGEAPGWHGLTYFRANRDVAEAAAQTCNRKIPKGDYILQLYAINGEPDQSYYLFRDDARDVELLIPGAPCPPYPLVRVRDVSGKRTLPNISDIKAREVAPLQVELRASGSWFDGVSNFPHSIDPADASYVAHNFEFVWTVESSAVPMTKSSGSSNRIVVPVKAIGCYRVHLTIRDRACDRSVTTTREAIVTPTRFLCTVSPYVVQNPTPDPSGIIAVAGLDPGPGQGKMSKRRELSLRVLISSESLCGGDSRVVAPDVGDLEFQLVWSYVNLLVFPPLPTTEVAVPSGEIIVTNLCRSVVGSPYTYFELLVRELGRARPLPIWADNGALIPVKIQWRTLRKRVRNAQGTLTAVAVNNDPWHDVSPSFRMTNAPESLGQNNWQGFYSAADQRYTFIHQASDNYQSHFAMGNTKSVPVGLPAGGPPVKIPSMANSFGAGLNTGVELVNGLWQAGVAKVDEGGEILSNKIQGGPLQIEALPRGRGGALEGAGGQANLRDTFSYAWCKDQEIFNKTHEQTLFNAVIFATVIPPGIPVTVWASIGLALKVAITAQAGVLISLFDALEGGNFVQADLFFNSELGLHIPASIRADVLFGVASVEFKLRPAVNALFRVHVGNRDLELIKEANLTLFLKLTMEIEVCILSFLKEIPIIGDTLCTEVLELLLINEELINYGDAIAFEECPDGGGGALANHKAELPQPEAPAGAGAGGDITIKLESYFPATKASRDGSVTIDVAYEKSDVSSIRAPITKMSIKIGDRPRELFATRPAWELEPAIGFLSNKRALIAWTRSFPQDAIDAGAVIRPDHNYSNDELNFFRAHDEIVITPVGETTRPNFWDVAPDFILSDPRAEVADPLARRVDGRAAVAGDETHQDALVAWVRIDDPEYFYLDPASNQQRLHLEKTAIFARAVDFDGVLGVPQKVSAEGINIEPSVAFSPSGNFAYCVWVNDPIHVDLLGSNRGRNLMYSIFVRSTNSWTAPQPIFAAPDSYPGMLEPNIALKGDDYGLLAFTALEASADEKDTGLLGGNRYVFISRLEGGVFGPPMLIHGKCEKRIYGSKVVIEIPPRGQDPFTRALKKWEWQVLFQRGGPVMSLEGAGGLMTAGLPQGAVAPTPAVAILADGDIRSNVTATATAGGISLVSLNLGPSLRRISSAFGVGGGGGLDPLPEGVYETTEIAALPDLAIASCALSNPFAGPGAMVTAKVKIENDGLLGSAVNDAGESLVGLQVLYIDALGAERVVATLPVPEIEAGTSAEITLTLEQPLDPVRLWVALSPNPIDPNPLNDSAVCFLGTPEPRDLVCELVPLGDEEPNPAALLTWTNPVPYEEIFLYRDGSMLAAIPGAATSFVDRDAGADLHTYEIRARIEVSKSCRVLSSQCQGGVSLPVFRRGDADANGRLEITDAVVVLGFLFLGGRAPACFDAADADDSGTLAITDPIRTLNYLFLGGAAPPAPGPDVCGEDPTADALECESESPGC